MRWHRGRWIAGFVVLFALAGTARGQFWVKKEYSKWSKSECQKMLSDSPWSNSYTIGTVLFQPVNEPSAVSGRDTQPQMTYTAQFWSARPVRQAIVRLQQLDGKYEKLSEEQKKAMDERSAQFIEQDTSEQIVIQVTYNGSQAFMLSVTRYWRQKTEGDLMQSFTLIAEGKRVAPAKVVQATGGGSEIQLIFPRKINGEPLWTESSKEVRLEIVDPNETFTIPFKVKNMKVSDALVY